jgi:hypothetical protein
MTRNTEKMLKYINKGHNQTSTRVIWSKHNHNKGVEQATKGNWQNKKARKKPKTKKNLSNPTGNLHHRKIRQTLPSLTDKQTPSSPMFSVALL